MTLDQLRKWHFDQYKALQEKAHFYGAMNPNRYATKMCARAQRRADFHLAACKAIGG